MPSQTRSKKGKTQTKDTNVVDEDTEIIRPPPPRNKHSAVNKENNAPKRPAPVQPRSTNNTALTAETMTRVKPRPTGKAKADQEKRARAAQNSTPVTPLAEDPLPDPGTNNSPINTDHASAAKKKPPVPNGGGVDTHSDVAQSQVTPDGDPSAALPPLNTIEGRPNATKKKRPLLDNRGSDKPSGGSNAQANPDIAALLAKISAQEAEIKKLKKKKTQEDGPALIPRPAKIVNIQKAMQMDDDNIGEDEDDYRTLRSKVFMRMISLGVNPETETFRSLGLERICKYVNVIRNEMPIFEKYTDAWPIAVLMQSLIKNRRHTESRKKRSKRSKRSKAGAVDSAAEDSVDNNEELADTQVNGEDIDDDEDDDNGNRIRRQLNPVDNDDDDDMYVSEADHLRAGHVNDDFDDADDMITDHRGFFGDDHGDLPEDDEDASVEVEVEISASKKRKALDVMKEKRAKKAKVTA
ncbi:hypothetical protein CVT24_007703 [Panaeolus cyanescens]|uniref:Uncharacterized protein n=1 Tax=Panaeolus cyanescens TaxID=181874 RepID=A0A409VRE3_9AGAR|nr:hypothetical protein CVT24_007703 [Panaeolus cyanescens]